MAKRQRRDPTPWWLRHIEFFVVLAVMCFAVYTTQNWVVVVALTFLALAVLGWDGPWPWWTRGKDPPE